MNYHLRIENKAKHDDVSSHTDQHEEAWKAEFFYRIVVSQGTTRGTTPTLVQGARILRPHLACVLKAQINKVSSLL